MRDSIPLSPFDLKISIAEGQVYWSDSDQNIISVMRLDGSKVGVIVNNSVQRPRTIALAPEEGYF